MSYIAPSNPFLQSTEGIRQDVISHESERQSPHLSPHTASIHILDDDSLLNVFCLYRPFLFGEDEYEYACLVGGKLEWVHGRWWYKLAHVCKRWRNLLLASASYLDICLVCTKGTPVADMLAHSPSLPLIIEHVYNDVDVSEEDEVGLLLTLKQCRNRVRRVHLQMAIPYLHKLVLAMDEEFPILQHLIIKVPDTDTSTILTLPKTFQAPRLQHLALIGFVLPMEPRSFAVGLVTLALVMTSPTTYFRPNALLQLLSFTPQLETLIIIFLFRDVNYAETRSQLSYIPITTHVTLPNLRFFGFRGRSAFTESLVYWITTPRLAKVELDFFSQDPVSISSLLLFMDTLKNLTFDSAKLEFFKWRVYVVLYPREEVEKYALSMKVDSLSPDYQVSYMGQLFDVSSQMFSAVEHLTLERGDYDRLIGPDNKVEWRRILRPFYNVKTLHVNNGFVEELSRCLQLDDGEHPLELLPELQGLTYKGDSAGDAFTSFIDARQNAGRPVTLVCHRRPYTGLLESTLETPAITSASGKTWNELDA